MVNVREVEPWLKWERAYEEEGLGGVSGGGARPTPDPLTTA